MLVNQPSAEKQTAVVDDACGCIFSVISTRFKSNSRTVPSEYPATSHGNVFSSTDFTAELTAAADVGDRAKLRHACRMTNIKRI